MRVFVIGASGTIGEAVVGALRDRGHQVTPASRTGSIQVDLDDSETVRAALGSVGELDAVICCAANGKVKGLLSDQEVLDGISAKLLGQVGLVKEAVRHLADRGSITLTSGHFEEPFEGGAYGAMVNAALEAFVSNAVIEMPRGIRVNAVSPPAVLESGNPDGLPAGTVAEAYVRSVEGTMNGHRLDP